MSRIYEFSAADISGKLISFDQFRGKVLLIVNTASKCGLTPQYEGLEKMYRDLRDEGLVVLGFPCNQFAGQEPGEEADISQFCSVKFNIGFPMFGKVDVNGPKASPLWKWLKSEAPGLLGSKMIKWNFTKFLVDREGGVVERFAPSTPPEAIRAHVEALL